MKDESPTSPNALLLKDLYKLMWEWSITNRDAARNLSYAIIHSGNDPGDGLLDELLDENSASYLTEILKNHGIEL